MPIPHRIVLGRGLPRESNGSVFLLNDKHEPIELESPVSVNQLPGKYRLVLERITPQRCMCGQTFPGDVPRAHLEVCKVWIDVFSVYKNCR